VLDALDVDHVVARLEGQDRVHALGQLAEDRMPAVEVGLGGVGDEELAAPGVLARVRLAALSCPPRAPCGYQPQRMRSCQ